MYVYVYYLPKPLIQAKHSFNTSPSLPTPSLSRSCLKRNLAPQPHVPWLGRLVPLLDASPALLLRAVHALAPQHLDDRHDACRARCAGRGGGRAVAARIDRQAARHSERDVPHPKAVVGDRQPAEHDLVARHRALGRRVRQRAVDARVGDRVRVHDACDLALLVLAAARERHEDLARVGELADGRAVHGARVDERADEGDAVGERAEGQEVGHAGFEGGHGGGGVGDGDAEAGVEGRDFVEGVVETGEDVASVTWLVAAGHWHFEEIRRSWCIPSAPSHIAAKTTYHSG